MEFHNKIGKNPPKSELGMDQSAALECSIILFRGELPVVNHKTSDFIRKQHQMTVVNGRHPQFCDVVSKSLKFTIKPDGPERKGQNCDFYTDG